MLLYIGNILSVHGGSIGVIEMLTPRLAERYEVKAVSSVQFKPLRLLHMLFSVWLYRKRCKLVLIDTFSTQAFWFAYLVCRICYLLKIPFVPFVHGGDFVNRLAKSKEECNFMFTRSYLNVVPSRFLEFHLKKASYAVKYIPNFVELKKYPFKQREFIQPRILWVRAFHKIYNPVMAVNVMAQLNDGRAQLCMVGADTDGTRSLVENRIQELNLSSQITLTGRLMKEEWIKLSQEYDIFINTTTIDNMPVSVIEAMALGLPVVSTAVGGVPYLIENNKTGILVESNNVEAMTNAIRHVLQNPDHAKSISLNARKEVEDFDWENVSLKWFDVLDGIMTRRTV